MSKTAMLVMGYREPAVLRSAIPIYEASDCDIYVHVDAKMELSSYASLMGDMAAKCRFVTQRHKIFWGGYSMIDAEISLILAALSGGEYARFCLISDDTFPLLSPSKLVRYLAEDLDKIMLRKLEDTDPFMRRYKEHFFLDHQATSLLGRVIETTGMDDVFIENIEALIRSRKQGKVSLPIYYGSQWWLLTRATILDILERLEKDTHLEDSFRFSAVPDEIMFQSLVGNYRPKEKLRGGPVYVEWSKEPKPFIFSNVDELAGLEKKFAFARKFSSKRATVYEDLLSSSLRDGAV